jgi:hypothetical protein
MSILHGKQQQIAIRKWLILSVGFSARPTSLKLSSNHHHSKKTNFRWNCPNFTKISLKFLQSVRGWFCDNKNFCVKQSGFAWFFSGTKATKFTSFGKMDLEHSSVV